MGRKIFGKHLTGHYNAGSQCPSAVVGELKDYGGISVDEFRVTFDSKFSVFILKFHRNLSPKNRTIWYSFSYYSTIFQIALIIVYIRVCKDNS